MSEEEFYMCAGMPLKAIVNFLHESQKGCPATDEFVRAQIMARKINIKVFKDSEIEDLKLRFYKLIVRYHLHDHTWMEIFRAYQQMWDTPACQADGSDIQTPTLKMMCIYLMLAPFDKDRTEQLVRARTHACAWPPHAWPPQKKHQSRLCIV